MDTGYSKELKAEDLQEKDVASAMLLYVTSNKDSWTSATSQQFLASFGSWIRKPITASRMNHLLFHIHLRAAAVCDNTLHAVSHQWPVTFILFYTDVIYRRFESVG